MLRSVPFLRILLPFITGILIQIWIEPSVKISGTIFLLSLIVFSGFILIHALDRFNSRHVLGISIFACVCTFGMLLTFLNTTKNHKTYFNNYTSADLYFASINEDPVEKNNSFKSVLNIQAVKANGNWKNASGKVLVYFAKETNIKPKYGQVILFTKKPVDVEEPSNPRQFNYKRYLSFHNTYHQLFLRNEDYQLISQKSEFSVFSFSINLRNKLLNILKEFIPNPRENAVASALVLGYNDAIDQDLINAYSSAGAMHVLCVSGLHVGIIYIVLSRLLNFLNRKRILIIVKFLLLLCFIWFYALITGLAPSVLRASTMISLIIIGRWIKGESNNVYNTLLVSIFLLLFINPYLITEVGFQLSYLAVFSIVYVHPKLFALIKSSSYLWNRVWEITSVSISAQLATFPLAALYFHKFPNLFFVSNLFVIPAATIILYGCILLMLFSWVPYLSLLIAKMLGAIIWFLNEVVLLIERIPYSIIDGISWTVAETWIVYLVIISTVLFLVRKVPGFIQFSLVSLCLLFGIAAYKAMFISKQNKIVVYNINKASAIDFISGNTNYLMADKKLLENENTIRFHILQNWFWSGSTQNNKVAIEASGYLNNGIINSLTDNYFLFKNKKIGVIDEIHSENIEYSEPLKLDLIVIRNMEYLNIQTFVNQFNAERIVLDSSWPKWKAVKLKNKFAEMGINAHVVATDKAFEWEI